MKSNALHAGDIVIMGQKLFGTFKPEHTAMALGGNKIAHSASVGVIKGDFPEVAPTAGAEWSAVGFRLVPNAGLASGSAGDAAFYADLWSITEGGTPTTIYGTPRASGIKQYLKVSPDVPPPFEFDALYRALKWASRNDEGVALSRNKGITCCAFVTACYQAGVLLRLASWDTHAIAEVYEELANRRVNKKDPGNHTARHQKVDYQGRQVENYYKREVSNVGAIDLAGPSVSALIQRMLTRFFRDRGSNIQAKNVDGLTGAHLFTPALGYDAKYYHSVQLYAQLMLDPMWTKLGAVEN
ncbi:hypothetical protein ACLB1G_23415 [Oxalobacteraceae bacterium A2-2]